MVKYIQQEMNDLHGDGKQRSYYKVPTYSNISFNQLLDYMERNKGMTNRGTVESVVVQLMESISDWLSLGHTVTVDHLGTFRMSVGTAKGKEVSSLSDDEPHLNASSLRVRSIRFKPAKEFVDLLTDRTRFEGDGLVRHLRIPASTLEERLHLALDELTRQSFLTVTDYMRLTHVNRNRATRELRFFAADPDSGITTKGRGSHKVYVKYREKGHPSPDAPLSID